MQPGQPHPAADQSACSSAVRQPECGHNEPPRDDGHAIPDRASTPRPRWGAEVYSCTARAAHCAAPICCGRERCYGRALLCSQTQARALGAAQCWRVGGRARGRWTMALNERSRCRVPADGREDVRAAWRFPCSEKQGQARAVRAGCERLDSDHLVCTHFATHARSKGFHGNIL